MFYPDSTVILILTYENLKSVDDLSNDPTLYRFFDRSHGGNYDILPDYPVIQVDNYKPLYNFREYKTKFSQVGFALEMMDLISGCFAFTVQKDLSTLMITLYIYDEDGLKSNDNDLVFSFDENYFTYIKKTNFYKNIDTLRISKDMIRIPNHSLTSRSTVGSIRHLIKLEGYKGNSNLKKHTDTIPRINVKTVRVEINLDELIASAIIMVFT